MSDYNKILVLEGQKQWEITKGNLRASVSIVGATYGSLPTHMQTEEPKYNKFNRMVEEFIEEVEGHELFIPEDSK